MEKWFVLVNPHAGGGKAAKQWPSISKELHKREIDFEFEISKSPADAIQITKNAIAKGFRKLIAIGGDGTWHLLINGIFLQDTVDPGIITAAIVPVGTGNDWIKTHQIPKSLTEAIQIIKKEKTTLHDVGKVTIFRNSTSEVQYFINLASFGFGGFVIERIERISLNIRKGIPSFVFGIFDALFKYHETSMAIELDDQKIKASIFNVNVGICRYCGGGMKMTPDAVFDDGWFDVTIVRKIGKLEVIMNIPALFNGGFIRNKKISQHRSKRVSILSEPFVPAETDGEVLGYGNVRFEMIEKSIRVIVP